MKIAKEQKHRSATQMHNGTFYITNDDTYHKSIGQLNHSHVTNLVARQVEVDQDKTARQSGKQTNKGGKRLVIPATFVQEQSANGLF